MTRRPNTARRNLLLKTAFDLFKEQGYEETTYQDIADAAGTTRTIVQSYFPKKTRFTEEIYNAILRLAFFSIGEAGIESASRTINLSRTCQIFLGYLLHDEPTRHFTKTTLSVRAGTAKNIVENVELIDGYCGSCFEDPSLLATGYTYALGGAYEVIYKNLCQDARTDIMALSVLTIRIFLMVTRLKDENEDILTTPMPEEQLETCFAFIERNLFKTEND